MTDKIDDQRRTNFFLVDNVIIEKYMPVIGSTAYAVYSYILYRNGKGGVYPSHSRVAKDLGIGESTVRKCLDIISGKEVPVGKGKKSSPLKEAGLPPLISITARTGSDGRQSSNLYTVLDSSTRVLRREQGGCSPDSTKQYPVEQDASDSDESSSSDSDSAESSSGEGDPAPTKPIDLVMSLWEANGLGEKHPEEEANKGKNFSLAKTMINEGVTPEEIAAMTKTFQKNREHMDVPPPFPMTMVYLWGKGGAVYKSWVADGRPGLEGKDSYVPKDPAERAERSRMAKEKYDQMARQQVEAMAGMANGEHR